MHASAKLWELYQEWKRLTHAEALAILSSDWPAMNTCQSSKQKLQPQIIRWTESAKLECHNDAEQREIDGKVREIVNELILLEAQNSAVLQGRLAELEQERASLDHTSRRLKQVHQSYVPAQGPAWDHYS